MADDDGLLACADLLHLAATEVGAAWAHASEQLNATLLSWEPGHQVDRHVNHERDVLLLVLRGDGTLVVDAIEHDLVPGRVFVIPRDAARTILAGAAGLAYLSVHVARGPLQVARRDGLPDRSR